VFLWLGFDELVEEEGAEDYMDVKELK